MKPKSIATATVAVVLIAGSALAKHVEQLGAVRPADTAIRNTAQVLKRALPGARGARVQGVRVHMAAAHTVDPKLLVCGQVRTAGGGWRLFRVETPKNRLTLQPAGRSPASQALRLNCGGAGPTDPRDYSPQLGALLRR